MVRWKTTTAPAPDPSAAAPPPPPRWSAEEDAKLRQLVDEYGTGRWTEVAEKLEKKGEPAWHKTWIDAKPGNLGRIKGWFALSLLRAVCCVAGWLLACLDFHQQMSCVYDAATPLSTTSRFVSSLTGGSIFNLLTTTRSSCP